MYNSDLRKRFLACTCITSLGLGLSEKTGGIDSSAENDGSDSHGHGRKLEDSGVEAIWVGGGIGLLRTEREGLVQVRSDRVADERHPRASRQKPETDVGIGRRGLGEAAHVQGRAETKERKAVKKAFVMGDEEKFLVGPVRSGKSHEEARPGGGGPKERSMDAKCLAR